jgi:Ca2+-binding RTX toxin-like protein
VIADVSYSGQTVLAGGLGNDTLVSQRGDTTFVFNRGDGQDVILDDTYGYNGENNVRFGAGITASDLRVRRDGTDLIIAIAGSSDQVTIRNSDPYAINAFYVGGVTLTYNDIISLIESEQAEALLGTSGDDVLTGTDRISTIKGFAGNDVLSGGGNNDVIEGGEGDDTLIGGTGRDWLIGEAGTNTYRVGSGSALDTITMTAGESVVIELGAGITLDDLSAQFGQTYDAMVNDYVNTRLVLGYGGNDAVVIEAAFVRRHTSKLCAANGGVFRRRALWVSEY